MMNINLGKRCKWEEIKAGEVFVDDLGSGDLFIEEKVDKDHCLMLDSTLDYYLIGDYYYNAAGTIHKLSKSDQSKWREE